MEAILREKCELLAANKEVLEKNFKLETSYILAMCSSIFTSKGKTVDVDKLKACKKIIKENTGVLSSFRGHMEMALASMMAVEADSEGFLKQVMDVYGLLKSNRIFNSEYLVIAAASICNMGGYNRREDVVAKTNDLYNKMKEEHPFLTSSEDSAYAAMLAMSDMGVDALVAEMEGCYNTLKGDFFSKNAVQSLSHVLALEAGKITEKCEKVQNIFAGLKDKHKKFGTGMELSVLGGLALTEENTEKLVEQVAFADDLLKEQKGFGGLLGLPKQQRLLYATLLVLDCYMEDTSALQGAAVSSVVALVIAQQVAMCAAVAASATAASASS